MEIYETKTYKELGGVLLIAENKCNGVPQSCETAIEWLQKSDDKGNEEAKQKLNESQKSKI